MTKFSIFFFFQIQKISHGCFPLSIVPLDGTIRIFSEKPSTILGNHLWALGFA
jgi:hypothetical protein